MPSSETKRIGGKIYTGISWSPKKRDAEGYARVMREKEGKLARVIRSALGGYIVYIRNR